MTGQIHDEFQYDGEGYSIVGIEHAPPAAGQEQNRPARPPLYHPSQHGLQLRMMHTACYRGYFCTFSVVAGKLVLAHLVVNDSGAISQEPDQRPLLDGVAPIYEALKTVGPEEPKFEGPPLRGRCISYSYDSQTQQKTYSVTYAGLIYAGICVPIEHFSGRILIGKDFRRNRYVHMGFQSPEAYRIVHEICVQNGAVTEVIRNKKLSRSDSNDGGNQARSGPPTNLAGWISERFSLRFKE